MHSPVVAVALWMLCSTAVNAQEDSARTVPASSATANVALDLAELDDLANTPVEGTGVSSPARQPAATARTAPATVEPAGPPAWLGVDDSEERAPATQTALPAANAVTSTVPKAARTTRSAASGIAWYRSPYVALGAVLALIMGLVWLARRYVPSARPLAPDVLNVVGRTAVSAKQFAVLLQVGRRLVLVGVTPDSMRALAQIAEPEEVAGVLASVGRGGVAFDDALAKEVAEYDGIDDPEAGEPQAEDEVLQATRGQLQSLLSKLRDMQAA